MTSKCVRGLILAAGAAGVLALSAASANASVNAHSGHPDSDSSVYITWAGPYATDAACQSEVAYQKTLPNTASASCAYSEYAPAAWGGGYDPGWWMSARKINPNF